MTSFILVASRLHRGCLPNGGARGEDFALNEVPHPFCVLNLVAKVWFFFEIAKTTCWIYCLTLKFDAVALGWDGGAFVM